MNYLSVLFYSLIFKITAFAAESQGINIPNIENNQDLGDAFGSNFNNPDPKKLTISIFNTVISLSGAIFMIMLLVGGITYLTGAGNEEQTGKAKKIMIDATVGLILTLGAYGIGKMVIEQLS